MTQEQIELQNELRDRLAQFGIEALNLGTKELKTYKEVFIAIDSLLKKQDELSKARKSAAITIANVARECGICKSTIDHNEEIKSIIRSHQPRKAVEETVPKSLFDSVVSERDSYKKKHREARKTELELYAAKKLIEDKDREIKMLQDNAESLYEKIEAIKNKDSGLRDIMDRYFPSIPGTHHNS